MTEQEKELWVFIAECVNGMPDSGDNFEDCKTLAKALIQRYPQILAEKVWEGLERNCLFKVYEAKEDGYWFSLNLPEKFEVFIREVKE